MGDNTKGTDNRGIGERGVDIERTGVDEALLDSAKISKKLPNSTFDIELYGFLRTLEEGFEYISSAPSKLILPLPLFRDILEQFSAAAENNREQGLVFGYISPAGMYGSIFVDGRRENIDFSNAINQARRWSGFRILGFSHTHVPIYGINSKNKAITFIQGGGHSGQDIANFFRRNERVSIVVSSNIKIQRIVYFLFKPRNFTIPGTPGKTGQLYNERIQTKLDSGVDPVNASIEELTHLSRRGAFVFYFGTESRFLFKQ